jgi:hypothetical protein
MFKPTKKDGKIAHIAYKIHRLNLSTGALVMLDNIAQSAFKGIFCNYTKQEFNDLIDRLSNV